MQCSSHHAEDEYYEVHVVVSRMHSMSAAHSRAPLGAHLTAQYTMYIYVGECMRVREDV